MRTAARGALCAVICFACVFGRSSGAEAPAFGIEARDGAKVEIFLETLPALTGCGSGAPAGEARRWECDGAAVEISVARAGAGDLVTFDLKSADGGTLDLIGYGARVEVPSAPGDGLWSYNRRPIDGIVEENLEQPIVTQTTANYGIPFLALVDPRGNNRLALGLVAQDRRTLLEAAPAAGGGYRLQAQVSEAARGARFHDGFYVSRAADSWFETARAYTAAVDRSLGHAGADIPEQAYDPTYDSWYWSSDQIDEQLVWQVAERSSRLGFKALLLDAGWDTAAGEYGKGIGGSTGDYAPPHEAFPDFQGLLRRMREDLGLRVVLWMQQYALGRGSSYFPDVSLALTQTLDPMTGDLEDTLALCPRSEAARRHMSWIVGRVVDEFSPDGLWLDWQDNIPVECAAPHAHDPELFGAGYNAAQRGVADAIAALGRQTVVELRWPYANLNNKPYAQLWQPIDTPDNFEVMRLQTMILRPFSAGVAIGTDEMYWRPEIDDEEAARFMAAVVFSGVPYFGPNLLEEPESRGEILAAWLAFYEQNRRALTRGAFRPYGDRGHPDQVIESENTAFVYYGNRYRGSLQFETPPETIHVCNASSQRGIDLRVLGLEAGNYRAEISDLRLRGRKLPQAPYLGPVARLQFDVPIGCLLTLRRVP